MLVLLLAATGAGIGIGVAVQDRSRQSSRGSSAWRRRLPVGSARVVVGPDGGSVWRVMIHNSFAPTSRPSFVYLPPYRVNERYPVVYLLHGFPGSPSTFVRGSRIAAVADDLISTGKLRPLIVVMPVAGPTLHYDGEWAGPWESFVVGDVLPWTDAHLPTIPSMRGRAIGGLSAGGYGAIDIALRHPGLFRTIEAWAGYFHPLRDGPFVHATLTQLALSDPTRLADRLAPLLRRERIRVFLAAGTQDPIDVARARSYAAELARLHIDHVLVLRPGGHHDSFWRSILVPGLAFTFPGKPGNGRPATSSPSS